MKAIYVGSVRGYQPPVYRPGMGWTAGSADHRSGRGPAVFAHKRSMGMGPFTVAEHRRTSLRAKVAISAMVVTMVAVLAILLSGSSLL